jgi:hypothetical protein
MSNADTLTPAERYAASITAFPIAELMDALVRASIANQYGEQDEQIAIIRAEITARVA